ncbi:MAG: YcxB family protein [Novosphingobium sp.]
MRKAGPPLVLIVSLMVGALVALATARFGNPGDARRSFGLATALCALFLGLQYLMLLRMALATTRRSIESLDWSRVSGEIAASGLHFDMAPVSLAWADLRSLIEGPGHFVCITAGHPPIVIPKRALDGDSQSLLRQAQVRA